MDEKTKFYAGLSQKELDLIYDVLSPAMFLKHKDDPVWLRRWLDKKESQE